MKYTELTNFLLAVCFALILITSAARISPQTTTRIQNKDAKGYNVDVKAKKPGYSTASNGVGGGCWQCWPATWWW
ncbi:hypothetical protein CTI12_AA430090 [Artemisia annua]|uniref:Transmembrane protein n=1 Tax=Artemisia annua TaxID=35608 RepID=A0A2U1M1E2_ARTAN|nr:hypothetical protein CTI12_AA430090 [Artemisia annua]